LAVTRFHGFRSQSHTSKKPKAFWECLCRCGCSTRRVFQEEHLAYFVAHAEELTCIRHWDHFQEMLRVREKDSEKRKGAARRSHQNHLDAAWTQEMEDALRAFQPACAVCGSSGPLTVDHVIPLSKGYGLCPGNAVLLCPNCNSRKGKSTLSRLPSDLAKKIRQAAVAFKAHWHEIHPEWTDSLDGCLMCCENCYLGKDALRRAVCSRDGHCCTSCGLTVEEHWKRLSRPLKIHCKKKSPWPIRKKKWACSETAAEWQRLGITPEDCVTLCDACHTELHYAKLHSYLATKRRPKAP
jgi:5-methylcytosine-specific restriction endonuclease McrA